MILVLKWARAWAIAWMGAIVALGLIVLPLCLLGLSVWVDLATRTATEWEWTGFILIVAGFFCARVVVQRAAAKSNSAHERYDIAYESGLELIHLPFSVVWHIGAAFLGTVAAVLAATLG